MKSTSFVSLKKTRSFGFFDASQVMNRNRSSTFSMENLLFMHALSSRIFNLRWTNKSMNFHGSNAKYFKGILRLMN